MYWERLMMDEDLKNKLEQDITWNLMEDLHLFFFGYIPNFDSYTIDDFIMDLETIEERLNW